MARVDFYVLSQSGEQARRLFACKLAEKAYRLENTVHIIAASRTDAERLDELLWTFRDGSFVPHHIVTATGNPESPISIGCDSDAVEPRDLLINLCDEVPATAESFPRVAELVSSDQDSKQRSRARYSHYRDQGHELNTHKL
jgi:DNA polymerase-3 subunit chi